MDPNSIHQHAGKHASTRDALRTQLQATAHREKVKASIAKLAAAQKAERAGSKAHQALLARCDRLIAAAKKLTAKPIRKSAGGARCTCANCQRLASIITR